MNIKSYLEEFAQRRKAGDRGSAEALLQMGMDIYGDRVMGVFDDVPLMDYPLSFMLMSKARQGLEPLLTEPQRGLTELLEQKLDATVISVRVKGGDEDDADGTSEDL